MTEQEARARELDRWIVEKAKSVEANRQRQRREEQEARRRQEEAEKLKAERARIEREIIEGEARRRAEKEWAEHQEIEDITRNFQQRMAKAEANLQSKRIQYTFNYTTASSQLDSQCGKFAKDWMDQLAKVKDPEMYGMLSSYGGTYLQLMREKEKRSIEEKLKREARECSRPYVSPFER